MELGIDIGSLDVAILSTYPGSIMAFRQQAGRAGRRDRPALVIVLTSQSPLDQYFADHPELLLEGEAEAAALDRGNAHVAWGQLGCAARELPITVADRGLYGEATWAHLEEMTADLAMRSHGGGYVATASTPRARDVNLRSIEGRPYRLLCRGSEIGTIDRRYLPVEAHPGAVYIHDGATYRVLSVDHSAHAVQLEPTDDGVVTRPATERHVDVTAVLRSRSVGPLAFELCELHVASRIVAYQEYHESTGRPRGGPVPIAPVRYDLDTVGVRMTSVAADVASVHALEHAIRSMAPAVVLCDVADLDGYTDLEGPAEAYVFDKAAGGVGLSSRLFGDLDAALPKAAQRLAECKCPEGCPSCVMIGRCLQENEAVSKLGALDLLRRAGVATPLRRDPEWVEEALWPADSLLVGRTVRHASHGIGIVTHARQGSKYREVTVLFPTGEKTLAVGVAKMQLLD